jgi:hypothetical protein
MSSNISLYHCSWQLNVISESAAFLDFFRRKKNSPASNPKTKIPAPTPTPTPMAIDFECRIGGPAATLSFDVAGMGNYSFRCRSCC